MESLPDTRPLTLQGDLAAQMVAGIDAYLTRALAAAVEQRERHWHRDLASHEAYIRSVEANRVRLRRLIGVVDTREPAEMRLEVPLSTEQPASASLGTGEGYRILAVRWSALRGVEGEGLLLLPDRAPIADILALPDCDWTPEMLIGLAPGVPAEAQFARCLAECGCRVLVPCLINRQDTYSGDPQIRMTNQPHREFLYRAAYELGRHIIGYEVQKALAAVDWFAQQADRTQSTGGHRPLGILGYGEGGLIAFYAAALETRLDAAAVCGYFQPREPLWREPIYRNVFGLLEEFGDAEIAGLIAPRPLVVEACRHPQVAGPPPPSPGRSGAAPGALTTPPLEAVEAECARARQLTAGLRPPAPLTLVASGDGSGLPGSEAALRQFLRDLGVPDELAPLSRPPQYDRPAPDPEARQKRQFHQLLEHTQQAMREAPSCRAQFWSQADDSSPEAWQASCRRYRDYLREEVIVELPPAAPPLHPRTRLVYDMPKYRGYEVVLDVCPDMFAYGILLAPADIREGERRPVVVCQHGLEGRPQDVADPSVENPSYHRFACQLAERGFVTYAPQNPYIGEDRFRVLQRKANPLKLSLFSFITRQHARTLEWLAGLPFVDRERIAFYGLSYGGKTAMRVPALLEEYCLSICSADYNEWIWKNASIGNPYTYLLTGEYEMPEFDLGNTFNYAELSWLICPRPFMVERGHHDGVAPDEWVAYEFARTRRRYDLLGLSERTEIEFFNGPHTIHGVGTFAFLHRHLNWPQRA